MSTAVSGSATPPEKIIADRWLAAALRATVPAGARHISALLALCRTPTANAAQLSAGALADVGVTIQLLRKGNAAFFFRSKRQIISVRHILVLLGVENVSELLGGLPALKEDGLQTPTEDPLPMLLGRSALAGAIANELAAAAGQEAQKTAVCAMLHSLGAILISLIHPRAARLIWGLRGQTRAAERVAIRLIGWRPTELGAAVARQWNLPGVVRLSMASSTGSHYRSEVPKPQPAVVLAREVQAWLQAAEMGSPRRRQEIHIATIKKTMGKRSAEFSPAAVMGISAFQEQNPFLYELLRQEELFRHLHL